MDKPRFEFKESTHSYTLDGKRLTGVTTIIGVVEKPALIGWASNMAIDSVIKEATYDRKENIYKVSKQSLEGSRKAWCRKRDSAGDIGTMVHNHIENYANSKIFKGKFLPIYETEQVEKMVGKFIEWAEEKDVTFLLSEQRLYSEEHWYAGTVDLVVEIKGKKYIADIKTARDIYDMNYVQMAGYEIALEELEKIKDCAGYLVINIPKELNKEGEAKIKIGSKTKTKLYKEAFLHCLALYRFINRKS